MRVPFFRLRCDGRELEYLEEVISSGWLTTARKTLEFEERFADAVGARFACAVNSCTAALHLAVEALGTKPGTKVFVPTLTFTATAEVIRYLGADPVFLDVDYGTGLVTPEILKAAIEKHPGVKTLMLLHYGGHPAPLAGESPPGLLSICRANGITIIEDAAHAFPTRLQGRMIGSHGNVACFSFYANKTITTGEGGMLTTDDEALAKRVKVMRLHGIDRDVWDRFTSKAAGWEYDVVAPGYKYNMPDTAAALGLAQLERAEEFRRERERCARFYLRELAAVKAVDLPVSTVAPEDHAWHLFPIKLNAAAGLARNRFMEILAGRGIGTSVHYKPLHRMSYYRDRYRLSARDFPDAERFWQGCVSLPIYPSLSQDELAYVCETIRGLLTG